MDRRSIHQLAATCKTNKKTTVVFCRPSDGKVSSFRQRLNVRSPVPSIQNVVPHFVRFASLLWKEKEDPSFLESRRFLPIKIGEGGSYFGKDDLFFFLCNRFLDRATAGSAFIFRWWRGDWLLEEHLFIS